MAEKSLIPKDIDRKLRSILEKHDKGILAVSGGPDSMALLGLWALVTKDQDKLNWHVVAVDHGLRPNSRHEAEIVGTIARQLGFPAYLLDAQKISKSNKSASSRFARYQVIADHARQHGLKACLTAHHKDDQIETVLMRFFRGSGIDGLVGMRQDVDILGLKLLRPLISLSKNDLTKIAQKCALPYFSDPSNVDLNQDRIKLRDGLAKLKSNGISVDNALSAIEHIETDAGFIQQKCDEWWDNFVQEFEADYIEINEKEFATAHISLQWRVLSRALTRFNYGTYPPAISDLKNLLHGSEGQLSFENGVTLHRCKMLFSDDSIIVAPEQARRQMKPRSLLLEKTETQIWDDRYEIAMCQQLTSNFGEPDICGLDDFGIKKLRKFLKEAFKADQTSFDAKKVLKKLESIPAPARASLLVICGNWSGKDQFLYIPSLGLDTHGLSAYVTINRIF